MRVEEQDRQIREAIRTEIRRRGLTQRDYAAQVGMTPSNLSALLAGRRSLLPEGLTRVLEGLDLELTVRRKSE